MAEHFSESLSPPPDGREPIDPIELPPPEETVDALQALYAIRDEPQLTSPETGQPHESSSDGRKRKQPEPDSPSMEASRSEIFARNYELAKYFEQILIAQNKKSKLYIDHISGKYVDKNTIDAKPIIIHLNDGLVARPLNPSLTQEELDVRGEVRMLLSQGKRPYSADMLNPGRIRDEQAKYPRISHGEGSRSTDSNTERAQLSNWESPESLANWRQKVNKEIFKIHHCARQVKDLFDTIKQLEHVFPDPEGSLSSPPERSDAVLRGKQERIAGIYAIVEKAQALEALPSNLEERLQELQKESRELEEAINDPRLTTGWHKDEPEQILHRVSFE
jgi:hypothetical protein